MAPISVLRPRAGKEHLLTTIEVAHDVHSPAPVGPPLPPATSPTGDAQSARTCTPPEAFTCDEDIVELQQAAADGDERAWRALVEHFSPLVWSVSRAHRLSLADAQDVYQFVWLSLSQHLGRITEPANLSEWLYVITRNECLRFLGQARHNAPPANHTEANHLDGRHFAEATVLMATHNAELSALR